MAKPKLKLKTKKEKVKKLPLSVSTLETGQASEFWKLICQYIDSKIEENYDRLRNPDIVMPAVEYKIAHEVVNAKIDFLEILKDIPGELIKSILEEEEPEEDLDPYHKD